ncbi:FAD-dependent monooxygenase [Variovorax sp. dw_954]|uniref:FAD-dependent monooxygenase n=1 Tax=Variovorax sp. dw_954 TaxID=2720078 RepID=UPI001BD39B76|nr:FAD-dependent monooxygenase [Variovorax sp. dw_954]
MIATQPILIVGAGPVGLTLALALKRQGVTVRIIDKNDGPTDKSKALVIWPRTLELLDINGCAQTFIENGLKSRRARIFANGEALLQIDLDSAKSDFGYALMIPQARTERLLEAELATLGIRVERNTELVSFTDFGEDGLECILRHADGSEYLAYCDYLAGCDGAHSTVRHLIGAEFEGHTFASGYVLADIIIDGEIAHDETTICWASDGILALFPMIGGRFRLIAEYAAASGRQDAGLSIEEVQAIIDARGPRGLKARDAVWTSHFTINERKVKDYSRGRVFLAGDAAHVHSPAGGQGMNTGMQDAFNLAWKMALVCHGKAQPALLDSYSIERSAIGKQVLASAGKLTRITTLRNPILAELRRIGSIALSHVPALRQKFVDHLAETNLRYDETPLNGNLGGGSDKPAAGERARDVPLDASDNGATRLHELLADGKFVMLSVGVPRMVVPEELRQLATSASIEASDEYQDGYVYLIRPDAYVALSTDAGNVVLQFAKLRSFATASNSLASSVSAD